MWIVWTHIQDGLCPKDQIRAGGVPRRRMHNHNRRSLQDKLREKCLQFSSHLSNAQETKTVKLTGKEFSTTYQKKECTLKTGVVTRTKLQRNAMFSLILTSTFMADSNYTHEGGVSVPGASFSLGKLPKLTLCVDQIVRKRLRPLNQCVGSFSVWNWSWSTSAACWLQFQTHHYSSARILCGAQFHPPHPPTHPLTYTPPTHTNHFLPSKEALCLGCI